MAGSITISTIQLDADNTLTVKGFNGQNILVANSLGVLTNVATPTIVSIANTNISDTNIAASIPISITGTNFFSGSTVDFIGANGVVYPSSTVTYYSNTNITATANTQMSDLNEPFDVRVTTPYGVTTMYEFIRINGDIVWVTPAGNLGIIFDDANTTVANLVATTGRNNAAITYTDVSGVLTTQAISLNSSTGVISTTNPTNVTADTTYTFTIGANSSTYPTSSVPRSFNIVVKPRLENNPLTLAYFDFALNRSWNNNSSSSTLYDLSARGKNLSATGTYGYSSQNGGVLTTSSNQGIRGATTLGYINNLPQTAGITMGVWIKFSGNAGNEGAIHYGDTPSNKQFYVRPAINGVPYSPDVGLDLTNGTDTWTSPNAASGISSADWIKSKPGYQQLYHFCVFTYKSDGTLGVSIDNSTLYTYASGRLLSTSAGTEYFGLAGDRYNDNASYHTYGGAFWYEGVISQDQIQAEWDRNKVRFGWNANS